MIYRRSVTVESMLSEQIPPSPQITSFSLGSIEPQDFYSVDEISGGSSHSKRKRSDDEDEEMGLFRRVRIKTSIFLPAKNSRPGSPLFTVEEIGEDHFEEKNGPALLPHEYEDAESEKGQSPRTTDTLGKKRKLASSALSDSSDEEAVNFEKVGSSTRRLRRKAMGERPSLIFDDPPAI